MGNNLNPMFSKTININYYFEMVQKLRFSVYDVDNESLNLDDDDYLGSLECTLGQVGTGYLLHPDVNLGSILYNSVGHLY